MWHASALDIRGLEGVCARVVVLSHMRRNVLIILGVVVLVWGVLALALGSVSLKLAGGSSHATRECLAAVPAGDARALGGARGHRRRRLAGARNGQREPAHADQLPRRA